MSDNRNTFRWGTPVKVAVPVPYALAIKQGDMLKGDLSSGVWGTIAIADARLDKPVLIAQEAHATAASAAADTRPKINCHMVNPDAVYNYLIDNADYASAITFGDRFEITGEQQLGLVTDNGDGVAMAVESVAAVATGTARYCNVVFMVPTQYRANT